MGFNKGPRTYDPIKKIKKCVKCTQWLAFDNFWKDTNNSTGLVSKCKTCYKEFKATSEYKTYRKQYEQTDRFKKYHVEYEKSKRVRGEKDKESRRLRDFKHRKENIVFKLKSNLSRRLRYFLKDCKKDRTVNYLGCSILECKLHLEKQFKSGMSWKNYGEWEIDHIIPLASAKNEQDVYKLSHYTNLQPLWKSENRKKSDKILNDRS